MDDGPDGNGARGSHREPKHNLGVWADWEGKSAPATGQLAHFSPGEGANGEEVEPRLLVPEELTPLPAVDRALPFLSLFPAVVGRRHSRYKIALLRTLQTNGSGRWKIRQIQEAIYWLEAGFVAELVRDLRDGGVVSYDSRGYYRLAPDVRVVAAIITALTLPEIEPRRVIKYLSVAMTLALTGGAEEAAVSSFASAVAVLRSDLDDLDRLIDDGSETALLEAARSVRSHIEDMHDLLEEHEHFRQKQAADPDFLQLEQDALDLVASVGGVAADVIASLTGKADELMRGGARLDRADIREFVADAETTSLARLIHDIAPLPPFVPHIPTAAAFDLFADRSQRRRMQPPPLPPPHPLERVHVTVAPDATEELIAELVQLRSPTRTADFVVQESWEVSIARHNAFVDAYTRQTQQLPSLQFDPQVEDVSRCGVARISKTIIDKEAQK